MIHLIFSFIGLLLVLTYNYISKTLSLSFLHPTLITIGFSSFLVYIYRKQIIKRKDTTELAETLKQKENIMILLGYKNSTYFFSLILATTDYFLLYSIIQFIFGCSHIPVIIFIFIVYGIIMTKFQNLNQILNVLAFLFIYNLVGIALLAEKVSCIEYFRIENANIHTYPTSGLFRYRVILIIILVIILFRKILLNEFNKQYKQKLCISARIGQIDAETFCCGILNPCPLLNIGIYGISMIIYGICSLFGNEGIDLFLRQSFSLLFVEILYCLLICVSTCILLSYTYMSKKFYEFCLVAYLIKFFPTSLDISIDDRVVGIKIPFYNFGSKFPLTEAYGFFWSTLYVLHVIIVILVKFVIANDGKFDDMGHVIDLFSKDGGFKLWQQIFVINQIDISNFDMHVLYFGVSLILFILCQSVAKFT